MWNVGPIQIQAILHIHTYKYTQNMYPKVGLVEEIREEEKKERKI
jgi:hypothetical protein